MRCVGLLLTLLLVGCSTPSAPYTLETIAIATATPIALPSAIAPNSSITIPLTASGTPEAAPMMELQVRVVDDVTGIPMLVHIAWIESANLRAVEAGDMQWYAVGVDLRLPGEASGWLVISAPEYETWTLQVQYKILTSRKMEMPVRLKRVGSSL